MRDDVSQRVSRVVWPWREAATGKPGSRWGRLVRDYVVSLVVAGLLWWGTRQSMPPLVVAGLGSALALCGWAWPRGYRRIHNGLALLGRFVGSVVTTVMLVPFYLVVFTLGRLLLLLGRRDPMTRGREPERSSYWVERPQVHKSLDEYRKQY